MGPRLKAKLVRTVAVTALVIAALYFVSVRVPGPLVALGNAGNTRGTHGVARHDRRKLAEGQYKVMALLSSLLTSSAPARNMISNVLEPNSAVEVSEEQDQTHSTERKGIQVQMHMGPRGRCGHVCCRRSRRAEPQATGGTSRDARCNLCRYIRCPYLHV